MDHKLQCKIWNYKTSKLINYTLSKLRTSHRLEKNICKSKKKKKRAQVEYFTKKAIKMANEYVKRYATSLTITEIQIKTTT